MGKYIDAEKLKAEIERQIQNLRGIAVDNPMLAQTMRLSFEDILSFIGSLQQEQPEVDLEEVIERTYHDGSVADTSDMNHVTYENIARYFYGLRNRALEEAARHVYESWMGGTMDDVRRDMVGLGKVLNARKEE